jgi:hypothetical protein
MHKLHEMQLAAQAHQPTRRERFVRWTRVRDLRWYMVPGYGVTYRSVMRFAHRFNWHYMPPGYPIEGDIIRRCSWCGVYHVTRYVPEHSRPQVGKVR